MRGYPGEYGAPLFEPYVDCVSTIRTAGGDDGFTQCRL
jgi:hypothetical protein